LKELEMDLDEVVAVVEEARKA